VRKLNEKKFIFLPAENLVQILQESGSGSAMDSDPYIINADPRHCQQQQKPEPDIQLRMDIKLNLQDSEPAAPTQGDDCLGWHCCGGGCYDVLSLAAAALEQAARALEKALRALEQTVRALEQPVRALEQMCALEHDVLALTQPLPSS
jgi:hypothetical protein